MTTDGNGDPDDPHDLEKGVMACDVSPVAMFFFMFSCSLHISEMKA